METEKNRRSNYLSNRKGEKNLITLIETENGWDTLSIGFQATHWEVIGERAGLAQAGELIVNGRQKTSIESYIHLYRDLFNYHIRPIQCLFEDFVVNSIVDINLASDFYDEKRKLDLIGKHNFVKLNSGVFFKQVTFKDHWLLKEKDLYLEFSPVHNLERLKQPTTPQQMVLF
ncbi:MULTISPECIES: hypothetical protein [Bacillus]|uniref:hypothetical protein n=1 Tax=Bacillus TaxID=1386 RepID=UPI000C765741|nr:MULTISPECIES: hypothetical protein [Bacillus]MCP1161251.1 hypothetical protein [Bacillus infantis]PLR70572.1 hypothetical protein CYJ37_23875 [Bacillus sp. UMB0728]